MRRQLYRFVCLKCKYPGGRFTEQEVKRLRKYYNKHGKLPFPCANCGSNRLKMRKARKGD